MKALILDNKVVDVVDTEFEVHSSMIWIDCPDNCKVGWLVVDGVATEPTEVDNRTYDEKRASEYPTIANQLDDIFHNGIDGWKATIQVTKDKYPKE